MADRLIGAAAFGAAAFLSGGSSLVIGAAIGAGFFAGDIIGALIPIPKIPSELSQQSGSQVYNAQSAQNQARLQQAKPLLYGRFRVFPDLVSQPWTEYVDNEQYLYQLMGGTLGRAELEQLYLGDTEIESLQEVTFEVYQPGETVDLFHTNVATNEEVKDLALALQTSASAGPVPVDYGSSTATTTDGSTPFAGFTPGRTFTITGSRFNDGTYETDTVSPTGDSITVTGVFVTETAEYVGPGGADLTSRSTFMEQAVGNPVGPFFVGVRGVTASKAAIDVEFGRGLYEINDDGDTVATSVNILVERRIEGTMAWTSLGVETFTAATLTPQRFTREYTLPPTGDLMLRHELQLTLQTPLSNTTRVSNEPRWTGLRGFIKGVTVAVPGPGKAIFYEDGGSIFPDLTVLAVKIRVSGQVAGGSSRRINGIFQRWLPVWNGSAWVEQATSSIVWAFADIVRNADYGLGLPDSALNLPELLAQDAAFTARGLFFNGYFDRAVTAWEAMKSIARCGNATPITDGRTFTLLVDEPRTMRAAMFTDRNVVKDSFTFNFATRKPETPRGLRVSYHDPVSFQVKTVTIGDANSTTDLTLFGCANRAQAWKVGSQVLAETLYRRINVSWQTEKDGFVPSYGALVSVQSFWADFGQSTEVEAVAGNTLTLADPFDWTRPGPYAVQLRDEDGTPTAALACVRGAADDQVVLSAPSPIAIYTGDERTRTHISLASNGSAPMDVLIRSIKANGRESASLTGVIDDARVYADPGPVPAE